VILGKDLKILLGIKFEEMNVVQYHCTSHNCKTFYSANMLIQLVCLQTTQLFITFSFLNRRSTMETNPSFHSGNYA
jgi:hypothetical protein